MTPEPKAARVETTLRLLRIANISRDLDRSREDTQFAEGLGKIIYVLDENIFEMFIKPFEHDRKVETFYSPEWGSKRVNARVRRRYEAQSALIAAEHLICGNLPGNADNQLYMTEPHRWELFARLGELTDEMRDSLANREAMIEDLHAKIAALKGLADQKPSLNPLKDQLDRTLAEDLEEDIEALKVRSGHNAALNRIRAARVAAEILANNKLAEPLDQLRRLTSEAVRGRIRDLQDRIECPANVRRAIEKDATFWLGRLDAELKLPSNQSRTRAQNSAPSKTALQNDALTIAYLRWAAKEFARRGERLLFVTADDLLFDTYRRWYSEPATDIGAEPFFMRRAAQYSPIFIPSDSGGDLSRQEEFGAGRHAIFDRVQEAIDATLIPIVLAEMADHAEQPVDGVYPKSRERLALKFEAMKSTPEDVETAAFANKLDDDFLTQQRVSLRAICKGWQSTQRLVIGASFDLLAGRLTQEQRELVAHASDTTDRQAAVLLTEYANRVLATIVDESVQLWLPLAQEFLAGRGRDVGLTVPSYQRLQPSLDLRRQFPALDFDRLPELIFAEAAISAIAIQDPNNAYRFARLALRAVENATRPPGLRSELRLLTAISCRLLICTVDLSARPGQSDLDSGVAFRRGLNLIKDLYAEASSHIHSLAAQHDAGREEGPEELKAGHSVRYLRALSERASLNLFTATALGLARRNLSVEEDHVGRYLELAYGDLKLCAHRDKYVFADDVLRDLHVSVQSQYLPNIAGYEVLAFILEKGRSYLRRPWPKVALSKLRTFSANQGRQHPLLRAELSGFAYLQDSKSKKLVASDFVEGHDKLRLALDRKLYREIFSKVFDVDTGKALGIARAQSS
jgi:hypothetical protein